MHASGLNLRRLQTMLHSVLASRVVIHLRDSASPGPTSAFSPSINLETYTAGDVEFASRSHFATHGSVLHPHSVIERSGKADASLGTVEDSADEDGSSTKPSGRNWAADHEQIESEAERGQRGAAKPWNIGVAIPDGELEYGIELRRIDE